MDDVEKACKSLYKSMKGLGTDESRLIKEIIENNNFTRQLIKRQYLTMYGKVNLKRNKIIFKFLKYFLNSH